MAHHKIPLDGKLYLSCESFCFVLAKHPLCCCDLYALFEFSGSNCYSSHVVYDFCVSFPTFASVLARSVVTLSGCCTLLHMVHLILWGKKDSG